jgi:hypothetical protein
MASVGGVFNGVARQLDVQAYSDGDGHPLEPGKRHSAAEAALHPADEHPADTGLPSVPLLGPSTPNTRVSKPTTEPRELFLVDPRRLLGHGWSVDPDHDPVMFALGSSRAVSCQTALRGGDSCVVTHGLRANRVVGEANPSANRPWRTTNDHSAALSGAAERGATMWRPSRTARVPPGPARRRRGCRSRTAARPRGPRRRTPDRSRRGSPPASRSGCGRNQARPRRSQAGSPC